MSMCSLLVRTLFVFVAGALAAQASDPTAVYARVDKVVLEPNPDTPETIQVWGVFSMAMPDSRTDYLPPARGYFYFKLADNKEAARKEWADLKNVAGSGEIVAFGSRFYPLARLRKADERPENPDPYRTNFGLQKVRRRTDYPPIRALLDYKD